VWFADIVGYTTLSQSDEDGALLVVEAFQRIAQEVVPQYSGRVVKYIGDAALAEFASTDGAIRSALALVERFIEDPVAKSRGMLIRVGVNVGEVISAPDGDIYGDGVNLASRLQSQAEPGQVVASETVHAQIRQRPVFRTESLGEKAVKGVSSPVRIFAVSLVDPNTAETVAGVPAARPKPVAPAPASPPVPAKRPLHKLVWAVPLALVVLGIPGVMLFGGGAVSVDRATYPVVEGGLEVAAPITLEFTDAIDRATVTSQNVRLLDAKGAAVPAEVSLGTNERSVTIKPRAPLMYAASYTLSVGEALTAGGSPVRGPDGGGPGASIPIRTQGVPSGAVGPKLTAAVGFDANAVPPEGPIRLRFSDPIDPSTAAAGVRLAGADGKPVDATVLVAEDNREVRLEPKAPLPAGGRYVVSVDTTVLGATGLEVARDSVAVRIAVRRAATPTVAQTAGAPGVTMGGGAPGTLSISVVPANAQAYVKVVIDGDTIGTAPLRGHPLGVGGSHQVILVGVPDLSSFALPVFRQTVTHKAGESMNIAAQISAFGSIDVGSQPSGAIYVDGRQVGRTPLAGYPVLAGVVHRLEIRPSPSDQSSYRSFTTEFRVNALEWKSLGRLQLPPN
jgi:hypothetical protein